MLGRSPTQLHKHILWLTLLPFTLITVILGVYFVLGGLMNMSRVIHAQGQAQTQQLAIAARPALTNNDLDYLQALTQAALSHPAIVNIAIRNTEHQILTSSQQSIAQHDNGAFVAWFRPLNLLGMQEYLTLTAPIMAIHGNNKKILGYVQITISSEEASRDGTAGIIKGGLIAVLIYLFALYLALRFSHRWLNNLEKLYNAIQQIADGQFQTRVKINQHDELAQLAQGINNMAHRLANAEKDYRDKLDKATHDLRYSYAEIEQQNQQLIHARTHAEQANHAKSDFLANISHEIRTPINGITGFIDVLTKTPLTPQQREYINTIQLASRGLLHLIDELLDVSRIESGKLSLELARIEMRSLLDNLYSIYSDAAFKKGIDLIIEYDTEIPAYVISDPARIEQILINLITNAIKFTQEGHIHIKVGFQEKTNEKIILNFDILDTGIGLDDIEISRAFREYEQFDRESVRRYGGAGLGLTITKQLVEFLGGEIGIESRKGFGSTFSFYIPCQLTNEDSEDQKKLLTVNHTTTIFYLDTNAVTRKPFMRLFRELGALVVPMRDVSVIPKHIKEHEIVIYSIDARCNIHNLLDLFSTNAFNNIAIPKIAFVSSNDPKLHSQLLNLGFDRVVTKTTNRLALLTLLDQPLNPEMNLSCELYELTSHQAYGQRLLIVDDNDINLKLMSVYLQDFGYHATLARNGREAIKLATEHIYDLIFLDLHMPIMDGFETTRMIRHPGNINQQTPIIGLSADGMPQSIQRGLDYGMNEFLLKPITRQALQDNLHRWLPVEISAVAEKNDSDADITQMLIAELPEHRDLLLIALEENNFSNIFQIAHKLLGGLAYAELPDLQKKVLRLQTAAQRKNKAEIHIRANEVLSNINKILIVDAERRA
ncbi:MAG: response regulator [Gammaproteobacteria bacterium]|nr:response regulator [Gammaproteobacteria bacterium]